MKYRVDVNLPAPCKACRDARPSKNTGMPHPDDERKNSVSAYPKN